MVLQLIRKIRRVVLGKKFPKLIAQVSQGNSAFTHISAFSYGNAGDALLPVVLRDLFNSSIGVRKWKGLHVHKIVNKKEISIINKTDALIIGGGGLFLKDTNPNKLSGWQWSCSINSLKEISAPIIMFAVGYNRFRGQAEFEPIFKEHLNAFVRQAEFIGIRNTGSIRKLQDYLSEDLKDKLTYQPCMTTVISKLYPNFTDYNTKENFIALNCAFDRSELRSNDETILESIGKVIQKLSQFTEIKYFSHMTSDNKILPYLDKCGIKYELVQFKNVEQIIKCYARARLVIGMRGHAQMIPFGCNSPILSIVSHDKMQWFLDDIHCSEWGVDVLNPDFENQLYIKAESIYRNTDLTMAVLKKEQERLWEITTNNLMTINKILKQ